MDLNIHSPLPQRRDFRIGIVGSGFIVNDCHLLAYRKAGFNPVGIASRTRERAAAVAARHGIGTVYDTPEQLLDDPSIEILDIAVPPASQLSIILGACARKTVKGILAQKPLGMNYAEALQAVTACEQAGITLAVNQNMRYDQSVRAAKTLLETGALGEPVFATIEMHGIPHWMDWHRDLGWLTLRIMSIHHLDTFRYWFGDPKSIFCSVRTDPRTKFPHTDGICSYILEYENGLRSVGIDDTWTGPAKEGCPSDIYIHWRIEGMDGLALGDIGWCKDPYTTPSTIRYATKGLARFECPIWKESWFPDAFIGTMAQLLIAVEDRNQPAIGGRDNLKTMALVEAAYESAAQGQAVSPHKFLSPKNRSTTSPLLTPNAEQAIRLARQKANRSDGAPTAGENVVLALTEMFHCTASRVLQSNGIELSEVARKIAAASSVENKKGKGTDSESLENLLSRAGIETRELHHNYLGTGHLLLALLRDSNSSSGRILRELGLSLAPVVQGVLKELDPHRSN